MNTCAKLDEGCGSTHKLSLGGGLGLPKLLQQEGSEESLKKQLTLRRIGKRQSQAIVNVKLRKTGFETFSFNLKKRARGDLLD